MKPAEFEKLVDRAFTSIPEKFRKRLDEVAIVVEDSPTPSQDEAGEGLVGGDGDLLGLYEGVPLTERGLEVTGMLPDKITLFRLPILEEAADSGDSVYQVVRETLIHEVAHHFGFDEDEIEEKFEGKWN